MKTLINVIVAGSLAFAVGCGDDDVQGDDDAPTPDAAVDDADASTEPPPVPTLGAQIDRVGRPAISTALIGTFAADGSMTKNMYNADANLQMWSMTWAADIIGSMAIYDGLNASDDAMAFEACGDQLLYDDMTAYASLGTTLALDVLILDSDPMTCNGTYLAVEAAATNKFPNDDCGGRVPAADVVDTSYSVLAGVDFLPPAVGDGVAANDAEFPAAFPYLAAPN